MGKRERLQYILVLSTKFGYWTGRVMAKCRYLALLFLFINYWWNSFLCIWMLEFEPYNSKKKKCIPEIAANIKAWISALIVRRDFLKDNGTQRNNLIEFNFFLVVTTTRSTIKIQYIPSRLFLPDMEETGNFYSSWFR